MLLPQTKRKSVRKLTKNQIIWSLFALLVWFNYVDTVQTYRLLELRAQELNPWINYLIAMGQGSFVLVIAYKLLVGIFMATVLFAYTRRSDRQHRASEVTFQIDPSNSQNPSDCLAKAA